MKILVCGGGGFLGGAILDEAIRQGHEAHGTFRRPTGGRRSDAVWHEVDLADLERTRSLFERVRPDVVVNAAAGPHRPTTQRDTDASWRDSVQVTRSVLAGAAASDCRLVHLASSHEGPRDTGRELQTVRGRHKAVSTDAVRSWGTQHRGKASILRPSSVYGPGEPRDRVVPTLLRSIATRTPFRVSAGARDFVFVTDVAAAVLVASACGSGIEADLGSGVATSIRQLVRIANTAVGEVVVAEDTFPPRPGDATTFVAESEAAFEHLGWSATTNLAEGLRASMVASRC